MKMHLGMSLVMVLAVAAGCGKPKANEISFTSDEQIYELCSQRHLDLGLSLPRYYQACSEVSSDLRAVESYQSCVREEQSKIQQSRGPVAKSSDVSASRDSAVAKAGPPDILTNLRESNVDEADFVKVSASQIFVAKSATEIQVIEREGKTLTGIINIGSQAVQMNSELTGGRDVLPSPDRYDYSGKKPEMFISGDLLIVMRGSEVSYYRLKARELPTRLSSQVWPGVIEQARLSGDSLILVLSERFETPSDTGFKLTGVSCNSITRPPNKLDLQSRQATRVASISLKDFSNVSQSVVLGNKKIYMTPKNVYLYESGWWNQSAQVTKLSLGADGWLGDVVHGKAAGRIKDVWALSELPSGELAVASSSGQLWNNTARNHFEIFTEKNNQLERVAQTEEYGANEDIRSVRFVGSMAYVVTFKNTDPLFAIDISNPSDPRILGELKIPGFSTYMHPLSETQLIGLGYDAIDLGNRAAIQGIQVSLFDTRRPTNLSRTDVKIHERGSSTPATADHRAFFMDQSESLFGFPFKEYNSTKQFDSHFSGALFYKVQGDQLSEEIRVTHEELISESCPQQSLPMRPWWSNSVSSPDIQRISKLAGEIVTVSQGALKTFKMTDTLEQTSSVRWSSACD